MDRQILSQNCGKPGAAPQKITSPPQRVLFFSPSEQGVVSMQQAQEQPGLKGGPAVYRKASGHSFGDSVAEAVMKRNAARSEFSARRRALQVAAIRPIADLIRADPSAAEAAGKLRKLDQVWISEHMSRPYDKPLPPPVPLMVGQGYQVFIPPYDYIKVVPDRLDKPPPRADPLTGRLQIGGVAAGSGGNPDFHYDGTYSATVGIGVDLQVTTTGSLELTPLVNIVAASDPDWWQGPDGWWGSAFGNGLDSNVEGHVTTTVRDAGPPPAGSPTADYELFSYHSDGQGSGNVSLSEQLAIAIAAVRGRTYQVWFNLVVNGDQSGDGYLAASSYSGGFINAEIPFFVTKLTPGLGL
jgi:hypothetical protein